MTQIPTPGLSMTTETVINAITPRGGERVSLVPGTIQNRKLLPLADQVAHCTIWLLECETNNVGSVKDPKDVKNLVAYKETLRRTWDRIKKYNRGGGDTIIEITHPIAFVGLSELQKMPNTPGRHLAYLNWNLYCTLLEKQGSRMQVFVDSAAIKDIDDAISEIEHCIDTEFGTGDAVPEKPGEFSTGENWPDFGRTGLVTPTPMGGNVAYSEPSSAAPPSVPPDSPDV